MMGHIIRFLDSDQGKTRESFQEIFGSLDLKAKRQGLEGQDKEDAVVEAYMHSLRNTGGFSRTCNAIVLHPVEDRTHFHLIYATRSARGVEVFKEAEKKGMEVQEKARAKADLLRREAGKGMAGLSWRAWKVGNTCRNGKPNTRLSGHLAERVLTRQ